MLSGNGLKTERWSYEGFNEPRRLTTLSGNWALVRYVVVDVPFKNFFIGYQILKKRCTEKHTEPWLKNQGTYRIVTFVYCYTPIRHLQYNITAKICVLDDIMNKRLRRVLRRLWSFHINLKLRFNLDFRESKPKFSFFPQFPLHHGRESIHPPVPANYIPHPTRPAIIYIIDTSARPLPKGKLDGTPGIPLPRVLIDASAPD